MQTDNFPRSSSPTSAHNYPYHLTSILSPVAMPRDRPTPGISPRTSGISRSIKPERNEPTKEVGSTSNRRLIGTPEGSQVQLQVKRSPMRQRPSPDDIVSPPSTSVASSSAGGKHIIKRRPPSPGMGMMGTKRPPSPGIGVSSRQPPSPGTNLPVPRQVKSENDSFQEEIKESPQRQNSVRFDLSPPKQRFVFSQTPSGVAPPSHIDVSSASRTSQANEVAVVKTKKDVPSPNQTHSPLKKKSNNPLRNNPSFLQRMAEAADSESDEDEELGKLNAKEKAISTPKKKFTVTSQVNEVVVAKTKKDVPSPNQTHSPLKKKSNNPLRNNPSFLQRMAEAADSESDEDEELGKLDAKEKAISTPKKKLTGMEKMKKLAEMSSAKDLSSMRTPDKGLSADEDGDFGSPVKFVDGPLLDDEQISHHQKGISDEQPSAVVNGYVGNVSNTGKHLSISQKSPGKKNDMIGLKRRGLDSVRSSSRFSQVSMKSTASSTKGKEINSIVKVPSPNEEENHTQKSLSPRILISDAQSPALKLANQSNTLVGAKVTKKVSSQSPEKAGTESLLIERGVRKKLVSSTTAIINVPASAGNSDKKQSAHSNIAKRKMTIAEKLEKKRSAIQAVRRDSNASLGGRSTVSGKSRRQILDKVKGRMSRSPSPSPLIKKHMPASPQRISRPKGAMQKMVEAREMKSISSTIKMRDMKQKKIKDRVDKIVHSKQGNLLSEPINSIPSLMSAPSDEHIKIAKSASSEHLSVQAGLNLLIKQNSAMHDFRNSRDKMIPTPKESLHLKGGLADNMARLNILKDEQRNRAMLKEQGTNVIVSPTPSFESSPSKKKSPVSKNNIELVDEDRSYEDNSKPADDDVDDYDDDDDAFSIDVFHQDLSPSPKEKESGPGARESKTLGSRSPWADVMEQRLKDDEAGAKHFHFDDHYDGGTWSSDGREKQKCQAPQVPLPSPEGKKFSNPPRPPVFVHNNVAPEMNVSLTNNFTQSAPVQMPVPIRLQQIYDEHVYVGAYEDLLPRSTNPLLVRTCEPTFPTSIVSINPYVAAVGQAAEEMPRFAQAEPVEYMPVEIPQKRTSSSPIKRLPEPVEHIMPVEISKKIQSSSPTKILSQADPVEHMSVEIPQKSTLSPPVKDAPAMKYFTAADTSETMQQFTPNLKFQEVKSRNKNLTDQNFEREPSPINSLSSSNSNDVYFSPPQNLVNGIQEPPQGEDESYLEESLLESTLIGQAHVHSMDEETATGNEQSESVAEWWDKSYAHTQNDHINSDIRKALTNSKDSISLNESRKMIDEDSDDDVFFGLDQTSPTSKVSPTQKLAPYKERSGKGRGGLETIDSEDDSDFDKIMDDQESLSPQKKKQMTPPPPPPPKSDPPQKESKRIFQQRDADTTFNGVSVNHLESSSEAREKNIMNKQMSQATRITRHTADEKVAEKIKSKDTIDDSTFGNATLETGTFGEYTNDDTRTYGDGTFDDTLDDRSYSSKSTRSDGSYTYGSATVESMALNKRERRKWSDWDRKDQDTVFSSYTDDFTMDSKEMNAVMDRRALAHEQLLMHAYTALSKPPPNGTTEKGTFPPQQPQLTASGSSQYQSDGENQVPRNTKPSKAIIKERQVLEKFCV